MSERITRKQMRQVEDALLTLYNTASISKGMARPDLLAAIKRVGKLDFEPTPHHLLNAAKTLDIDLGSRARNPMVLLFERLEALEKRVVALEKAVVSLENAVTRPS